MTLVAPRLNLGKWNAELTGTALDFGCMPPTPGDAPMSPEVARRVTGVFRDFRPADSAKCELSPHASGRVLRLFVDGHMDRAPGF